MSVIAGLVRFTGAPVHIDDLAPAAARLAAPGVGKAAHWIEGSVGLVVRQRVVTDEDLFERQPWVGGGGRLILVYDGRIDNREELAAALDISLNQSEIIPDGLLLLGALERWGEAALPRLIGDFALALWDTQNRKLLLARDQLGRRSLYYYQGNGFVAFATTYRALLALPGMPRKIDELGIADFLIQNTQHPVETFYEGVRRVPGATAAVFASNGLRLNRYWTPEPKRQLRLDSDQDYVEGARELLDQAVACRLRAKNGLASTLSGGLDSSAVAATAARLMVPNRLLTITSVPPEGMELPSHPVWYKDERPYVGAIAAMYPNMDSVLASSLEPHWIETDPTAFFEAGGLPAHGVTNIGWLMPGYQCLTETGISALLTGEGGNPAWSYDGLRRLNEMFRNGNWLHLTNELYLAGRRRPYGMDWKALLRSQILRPLEPPWLAKWRMRLKTGDAELWSGFSAIHPDFARDIDLAERSRKTGHNMRLQLDSKDGLGVRLEMLKRMEHGRDIFTALRTLTGIETRSPLFDIRLLEFCLSLPEEQFFKDGNFRRLPRLAMDGRLPQPVLENNLIGSQNPEIMRRVKAVRSGMIAEIEELKQVPLAARAIDLPRLSQIVRDWPDDSQVKLLLPRALHVGRFLRWAEAGKL